MPRPKNPPRQKPPKLKAGHPVTEAQWSKFYEVFSETANVSKSCEVANFSRTYFYQRLKEDAEFKKQHELEFEKAVDKMEEEARRRAFQGILEPVFHKGEVVGHKRCFSDGLAMFLLSGYKPKVFKQRVENTNIDAGPGGRYTQLSNEELDDLIKNLEKQ